MFPEQRESKPQLILSQQHTRIGHVQRRNLGHVKSGNQKTLNEVNVTPNQEISRMILLMA